MDAQAATDNSYVSPSLTWLGAVSTLTLSSFAGSRRDKTGSAGGSNDCQSPMTSGDRNRTSGGMNPFCGTNFP